MNSNDEWFLATQGIRIRNDRNDTEFAWDSDNELDYASIEDSFFSGM